MRLSESYVSPILIVIGWLITIVLLGFLFKTSKKYENKELTQMATAGAFVLVISSIPIPSPILIPIPFNLSGVMLLLILFGVRKGILVSSGAMILNHLIIPGSLGALGINLTNMIILSLILGYIPHKLIEKENIGRRMNYLITFSAGFIFIILDTLLVLSEMSLSHSTNTDLSSLILASIVLFVIIGFIEGFFTALTYSYYHRTKKSSIFVNELMDTRDKMNEEMDDGLYLEEDDETIEDDDKEIIE